ncbi:MAG TPA: peptidylprolyl isomerase [Dehalococcoidia bacterium]|nr:peptidylprolyl isomerase [Dehalococcoidia bacterium]
MTSRRQRRQERAGAQSVQKVSKYKPPFPLSLLSSQATFYVIGLLAIVGSLFFFFGGSLSDDTQDANEDVIDITPEEGGELDPNNPDATATEEPEEIQQFDAQPALSLEEGVDYAAVIETEAGEVTIDLLEDEAPLTVNNFVFLANQGFYDGQTFFRVIPDFLAQAGDPTGLGTGGPGYALNLQAEPAATPAPTASPGAATATATPSSDATPAITATPEGGEDQIDLVEGVVAMAFDNRTGEISGSQFFIVLADSLNLEKDEYVAFGEVLEGLDVFNQLTTRDPQANPNAPAGDEIISIRIVEQ